MNILIVENEPNTISDLKSILGKLKHTVVAVTSTGSEAIHYTGELKPDLILINIQLKGEISGVEAAQTIKKLYNIPIIFLTVFIKNCLNKSLQLPEGAAVLSMPLREDHLEYALSQVKDK